MTAGFVQTAVKFSLSVMHDMAGGILSQDFEFSREQTLSSSLHGRTVSTNAPV